MVPLAFRRARTIAAAVGLVGLALAALLFAATGRGANVPVSAAEDGEVALAYFAAGCFWCTEARLEQVPGVIEVISGYMGGHLPDPTYADVLRGDSGHREAVEVHFAPSQVEYQALLDAFWRLHDPTDAGGSFGDRGFHYSSAIFVLDDEQRRLAEGSLAALETSGKFDAPIATAIEDAGPFYPAEDYHQDFAANNPLRYRAYSAASGRARFIAAHWDGDRTVYQLPELLPAWFEQHPGDDVLRERLDDLAFRVTQRDATERAFTHPYDAHYEPGIYVDVVSGEPLFSSRDKFDSGTGWPSFSRPIDRRYITLHEDRSLFMVRTEVRSRYGDSHLGHVFDFATSATGERWCINGVALRFVPLAEMVEQGYGEFLQAVTDETAGEPATR